MNPNKETTTTKTTTWTQTKGRAPRTPCRVEMAVRLKTARIQKQLTHEDLAAQSGKHPSLFHHYEGARAAPSIDTLYDVVQNCFGMTMSEFFSMPIEIPDEFKETDSTAA